MVELDCLAALDHLQWLRTGARAAEQLGCSPSSISRSTRKCEQIFGIALKKRLAEWRLIGDDNLIQAERHLHQQHRWTLNSPLRLEAQHWQRHCYGPLVLEGWQQGNLNYLEYQQPRFLLEKRIIDGWLCSAPDAPDNEELTAIPLCSMPSLLVVQPNHPLAALGAQACLEDVRRYPLLPLPRRSFPIVEAVLDSLGLNHQHHHRLPPSPLPIEELMVGLASPLTISLFDPNTIALPIALPVRFGDVLVVRREFGEHPRTQALVRSLRDHLRHFSDGMPEVEIAAGVTTMT